MAIRRDCGRAILLILFSYYFYTFSTLSTTAITSVGNILHEKDIDDVLLLDRCGSQRNVMNITTLQPYEEGVSKFCSDEHERAVEYCSREGNNKVRTDRGSKNSKSTKLRRNTSIFNHITLIDPPPTRRRNNIIITTKVSKCERLLIGNQVWRENMAV